MKKFILILLTTFILITSLVIITSARNEDNFDYVIQFQQTDKAYPIMNNEEDAIGFLSYYEVNNLNYSYYNAKGTETSMSIYIRSNGIIITTGQISGSYPNVQYTLTTDSYDDFGIIYKNSNYYIVVWENGEPRIEDNWYNITDGMPFSYTTDKNFLSNGYYVHFPTPPMPSETTNIITPIIDSVSEFVTGCGIAFGSAFTSVFMTNGELNALSIMVLTLFGLGLAYGVIRFITGLFRKET